MLFDGGDVGKCSFVSMLELSPATKGCTVDERFVQVMQVRPWKLGTSLNGIFLHTLRMEDPQRSAHK